MYSHINIHCAHIIVKNASGRRFGDGGGMFGGEFVRFNVQKKNS